MGRELQKKKNRSSLPKKRQNGPSKKKVLSNPIIAKHWCVLDGFALCLTASNVIIGTKKKLSRKITVASVSHRV